MKSMSDKEKIKDEDVKEAVEAKSDVDVGVADTQLTNLSRQELMNELYRRGRTPEDIMNQTNLTGPELEALVTLSEGKAKGGVAQQMELFSEGGLKDEGGTIDPVSGNDVPPGSTQEEVRDDIPAQLSEGEFVFPADVVRFLGLNFLMELRQKAKAGLKRMEEMGQMGNSDEATLPDDIPFTMEDLDMAEDTQEDVIRANIGTFVPPRFNAPNAYSPTANPYSPTGVVPTVYAPYAPATAGPAGETKGLLGPSAQGAPETENRRYVNKETGQVRMIPFVKATGQSLYPIPEGFVFEPEAPKEEAKTTKVQTTKVKPVDTGDDSQDQLEREREEAMYGPGGGRISLGGEIDYAKTNRLGGPVRGSYLTKNATTFGIGYTLPGGPIPGATFIQAISAGLGNVPEGGAGKFTLNGVTITKSAEVTNAIIKDPRGPEARKLIKEHKLARRAVESLKKNNPQLTNRQAKKIADAVAQTQIAGNLTDTSVLDNSVRDGLINAVNEASKGEDGTFSSENFNQLGGSIQEAYYDAAENKRDEEEGDRAGSVPTSFTPTTGMFDDSDDYSDDFSDSYSGDPSPAEDDPFMNTGGLAGKKKKPKPKKMKRGGLASR